MPIESEVLLKKHKALPFERITILTRKIVFNILLVALLTIISSGYTGEESFFENPGIGNSPSSCIQPF